MNPERVAELYREGVDAIVSFGSTLDPNGWLHPACGAWDAGDTVRHVLAVSRWYDEWLTLALSDPGSLPFPAADLDEQNDRSVESLRTLDALSALAEFERTAIGYLERALANRDSPYAYPFGVVTVGLHLGVAATEWHLHAFDLARASGRSHEPSRSSDLFRAAGRCTAAVTPGIRGAVLRALVPLGARLRPWQVLLRESGR